MVDNVFGIHVIGQECRASGIMNRRTRCRQSTTTTLNKHMILMAAFRNMSGNNIDTSY
jgi:hypothetical protein